MLVKISGEALGNGGTGIDAGILARSAADVAEVVRGGTEVALVVGGGNLCRGAELEAAGLDRITGDQMGMLATVINALAFRDALAACGVPAEMLSAHPIATVATGYAPREARRLLDGGTAVLLAGGTGNPLFTTDTAACLRAVEVGAEVVVKATKVDGVYSADPVREPSARRYDELTYMDVIERRLGVMDLTAVALCREHDLPVIVCQAAPGALTRIARGAKVGTRIGAGTPG